MSHFQCIKSHSLFPSLRMATLALWLVVICEKWNFWRKLKVNNGERAGRRWIHWRWWSEFRTEEASWRTKFKDSAYVFVGGISFDLTEGDLLALFCSVKFLFFFSINNCFVCYFFLILVQIISLTETLIRFLAFLGLYVVDCRNLAFFLSHCLARCEIGKFCALFCFYHSFII